VLYVEIAKIVETRKKNVSRWGFQPGTNIALAIIAVCHLPSTTPPPPSVAILFIYQTRIGYIWIHNIRQFYEFIGHRWYEFILFMYEYISGGVICEVPLWWHLTHRSSYEFIDGTSHINAAYRYCPDQLGCVRLPRPVRVRSAAPTSSGTFGCPDQLGCAR